ncbi:MAG: hypothetical protein ACLVIY_10665 [Anaerobutyricum soehngenii]
MRIQKQRRVRHRFVRWQLDKVSIRQRCRILICAGTGCLAGGSGEIYEKMCELIKDCKDVDVEFGQEIAHGRMQQQLQSREAGVMAFVRWDC